MFTLPVASDRSPMTALGSTRPYNWWRKGVGSVANGGRSRWEEGRVEDFYAAHRQAVAK